MKNKLLLFGLLLLLVSPAYAVECGFGFGIVNNMCVPNPFINWATILAVISVSLLAIGYMIAQSLQSPRLINLVKGELYQTLATLMIVAFYMGGMVALNSLGAGFYSTNLAYPGEPSVRSGGVSDWSGVNNHVISYIKDDLYDYISDRIEGLGRLNAWIGVVSGLSVGISVSGQSYYAPLFAGVGSLQQSMGLILGIFAASAIQLTVQLEIMKLWPGLFGVLLPFGIALRMLPFTRAAGGVLIAIVFGFTILLPVMYLLIQDVSSNYRSISGCTDDNPDVTRIALRTGMSGLSGDVFSRLQNLFGPGGVLRCIAFRIGIEATILPFFAYLMALNATRRLAEILGAEVNLSALVRII